MSSRKKAVSAMIGGLSTNSIIPYKNTSTITFDKLDIENNVTNVNGIINSTRDISDNNNIVNKTYFVKFNTTTKQLLLSEDETTWLPAASKLKLYVGATYTFIQKNTAEYNNSTNPFLLSSRNVYEKPRLFPLYNDNIIYQIYDSSTSSWTNKTGADPDGALRTSSFYTQPLTGNVTQRKLIFSPSKHNTIYYITEQFTSPNITGGILSIDPNYYKYGSAITNSGMAVKKNINVGLDFRIDDIFIAKNTNTVYTTDKVNGASYYPDYYKEYIGVGTNNPIASLDIGSMKNAMMIPVGNDTTEKPEGHPGMIRYNNEIFDYEGKGRNEWGTLGGIQDIDMNTKIELFAGLPTDDLATLTCITTDEIRFHMGNDGVGIQHNTPSAMLDIKGNFAVSNHTSTNVGGVTFGHDTSLSDNHFRATINTNISNESIVLFSHNGGFDLNVNKSSTNYINSNKTSQISQNLTETISGNMTQITENSNIINYSSLHNQTITSHNHETHKNHGNISNQTLHFNIKQDSTEIMYNNSYLNHTNTDKSVNLYKDNMIFTKNDNQKTILNDYFSQINNNSNQNINGNINSIIKLNDIVNIKNNVKTTINNNSSETYKKTYNKIIEKNNHILYENTVSNTYNNNVTKNYNQNYTNLIKTNNSEYIENNTSCLIETKNSNMEANHNLLITVDENINTKTNLQITNNSTKTIYTHSNKNKTVDSEYELHIKNDVTITHNKNQSITTKTNQTEHIKSTYKQVSNSPYVATHKGQFDKESNSLTDTLNSSNDLTFKNTTNKLYKNNRIFVTLPPQSGTNTLSHTIKGHYITTNKDDLDITYNDTSSQIIYNDNTTKVTQNLLETYIKKLDSTVYNDNSNIFSHNHKSLVESNLGYNININYNRTVDNVSTDKFDKNNIQTINQNYNEKISNTDTVNYHDNLDITITNLSSETYSNTLNQVNKKYNETVKGNMVDIKNEYTFTVNDNSTETLLKDHILHIDENVTKNIKNDYNVIISDNKNSIYHSNLNTSINQILAETIDDKVDVKITGSNIQIIDNNVIETYNQTYNLIQNSVDTIIVGNKIKLINNNNNQIYNANNSILIKDDSIETITGKFENYTYSDYILEQHNGDIELNTKN